MVGRRAGAAAAAEPIPIDIVLLWVNGSDPHHAAVRAQYLGDGGDRGDAATANRWRDNDELRHALRSIDKHAPWVRQVFVVTSLGQVPRFLAEQPGLFPRARVVHDRDLMPAEHLPTFNNHAVEAWLHRIPGLSEVFVKMDDDQIFGRPVFPEDFYSEATGLRVHLEVSESVGSRAAQGANSFKRAMAHTNALVSRALGVDTPRHILVHAPHALRRSTLARLHELWPEEMWRSSASRFRGPDDVDVVFASHHLHLAEAAPGSATGAQLLRDEFSAGADLRAIEFMLGERVSMREGGQLEPRQLDKLVHAYRDYTPGMNAEPPAASRYVKQRTTFKFLWLTDDAEAARRDLRSVVRIRRKFVTVNDDMKRGNPEVVRLMAEFYEAMGL